MKAFSKFSFKSGKVAELDRQFPSYLSAWEHGEPTELCDEDTHFLYFHRGGSLLFGELEYRMMRVCTHPFPVGVWWRVLE